MFSGVTAAGQLMSGSDVMLCQDDEEFGSIEARQNLFDVSAIRLYSLLIHFILDIIHLEAYNYGSGAVGGGVGTDGAAE